jgi:HEAT repeat protein
LLVVANRWIYNATHSSVETARKKLGRTEFKTLSPSERSGYLQELLRDIPRRTIERVASSSFTPDWMAESFAVYLVDRWGIEVFVHRAQPRKGWVPKWRRIAALRILFHVGYEDILVLLENALRSGDRDLAGAAVVISAKIENSKAAQLLIDALVGGHYPASRIATHLDHFPIPISGLLRPLLRSPEAVVRFWGVTLLSRYKDLDGLDAEVSELGSDADARVRKASVETLGVLGGAHAAQTAVDLLQDENWFVRAHAARALGDLGRSDLAGVIAPLLADPEWWVRCAAKESLEAMAPESLEILVDCLDHPDRFARNGAAEVLQNTGYLDRLLSEFAGGDPSPGKKEILRKAFVAGGVLLVDAVVGRGDAVSRSRFSAIVEELGLGEGGEA